MKVPNLEPLAPIEVGYHVATQSGKIAEACSFDALQRNLLSQLLDGAVLFFIFQALFFDGFGNARF